MQKSLGNPAVIRVLIFSVFCTDILTKILQCHCFPMYTVCPSCLIVLEVMTLIFNYLPQTGDQLYQQAVNIAQLVISVIQSLEHASKVG